MARYNFKRESTNRKLTLEEAEEYLEKKKKRQAGMNFQRWLMKNDSVAKALTQDEFGAGDEVLVNSNNKCRRSIYI